MDLFSNICATCPSQHNVNDPCFSDSEDIISSDLFQMFSDDIDDDLDHLSLLELEPIQNDEKRKMEILFAENIKKEYDFNSWTESSYCDSWQTSDHCTVFTDELLSQLDPLLPNAYSDAIANYEDVNRQKSHEIIENLYQAIGNNCLTMTDIKNADSLMDALEFDVFSLFGSEDSSSLISSSRSAGIEATDIGTLLKRFEEHEFSASKPVSEISPNNANDLDEANSSCLQLYSKKEGIVNPLKITLKVKKESKEAWLMHSSRNQDNLSKQEKILKKNQAKNSEKVLDSKIIEKMKTANVRKSAILIPVQETVKTSYRKSAYDSCKVNNSKVNQELARKKAYGSLLDHDYHKDWILPNFQEQPSEKKIVTSCTTSRKATISSKTAHIASEMKPFSIDISNVIRIQSADDLKEEDEIIDVVGLEEDEVMNFTPEDLVTSFPKPDEFFQNKCTFLNALTNESTKLPENFNINVSDTNTLCEDVKGPSLIDHSISVLKDSLVETVKTNENEVKKCRNKIIDKNEYSPEKNLSLNLLEKNVPKKKILPIQYQKIKNSSDSDIEDGEVLDTSLESNTSDSEKYDKRISSFYSYYSENSDYIKHDSSSSSDNSSDYKSHRSDTLSNRYSRKNSHHRSRNSKRKHSYRNKSHSYSEESSRSRSRSSSRYSSSSDSLKHRRNYSRKKIRYSHSKSSSRSAERSVSLSFPRKHRKYRSCSVEKNKSKKELEKKKQIDERRVVYIGNILSGTTKHEIHRRFVKFGPIEEVSVHFRQHGDNYSFVTFVNRSDAFEAVEHGNDDENEIRYDLCFGGRRFFCRDNYKDLDSRGNSKDAVRNQDMDFDTLLQQALKRKEKDLS